jgi:hypothetical protein
MEDHAITLFQAKRRCLMIKYKDSDFSQTLCNIVGHDPTPVSTVYVSPYIGKYSDVAGVVITVPGTPPKATLFVPLDGSSRMYSGWGDPRVIESGTGDFDAVMGWLERRKLVKSGEYIGPKPGPLPPP